MDTDTLNRGNTLQHEIEALEEIIGKIDSQTALEVFFRYPLGLQSMEAPGVAVISPCCTHIS